MNNREQGVKKLDEKMREAAEEGLKADQEILKIQREQMKEQEKAERELGSRKGQGPEERAKIERDFAKEMRKRSRNGETDQRERREGWREGWDGRKGLSRAEEREHKIAQKIYWIVIDMADVLDEEVGKEDVESLESK
jgi:hypothetical protein